MKLIAEFLGMIVIFVLSAYKSNYLVTVLRNQTKTTKEIFKKTSGWFYSLGYFLIIVGLHFVLSVSYEYFLLIDLFVSLSIISIIDIKFRIVPNSINFSTLLTQLIIRFVLLHGQIDILNLIFSSAIFLFLVIVSRCTNEQFGMGDIKLLAIMMIVYGLTFMLHTMLISMLLVILVTVPFIICRKISIKSSVPFIPFYSIGVLGYIILNVIWR